MKPKSFACATVFLTILGCHHDGKTGSHTATVGRRITISVTTAGYTPASVAAAPQEDLVLVFTRTEDTHCGAAVRIADTDVQKDLPLNTPVEIALKAPASGELAFTCGMGMMQGSIVVSAVK